jgi:F5/8 type C domain-containing protein
MRPVLLATAGLAALTVAYTWPLAAHLGSAVAHDRGDPLLVTWILWWNTHAVPLTDAWWNAPAFYPSHGVLAFSENLLGLAPITAPIIALTQAPLLGYNAAFLLSYLFSGLGAYGLAFVLTRRHDASFVAALAFAFAPYRLSHTQHLQLLSSYWMPVTIAALHLFLASPKWRWAALFAISWLLQALACGYYLFFLTIFVLLWLAWFAPRRLTWRAATRLAVAWGAAGLAIAPVLLGYRAIHAAYGFKRSPVEVLNYSADVAGLWSASPDSLTWRWLHAGVGSESEQFPGLMVLLLLAAGVVIFFRHRRSFRMTAEATGGIAVAMGEASEMKFTSHFAFYALTAVLMWVLSLGPRPTLHARPLGIYGPYALLMNLPGFNGMRVPARLWMVAVLCLGIVAALVISRIEARRMRRFAVVAAAIGLLVDGWPRAFPVVAVPPMRITSIEAHARLGLPVQQNETETMYGAIVQARPVFNGYSGYTAPQHAAMRDLLEHHDPRILARLAATDPIEIVIESANDIDGAWSAYVAGAPGARRVDMTADWTSYAVPRTGALAPGPETGKRLAVAAIATTANVPDINAVLDGDLETRWHSPSQRGGEIITIDLGRPQFVAAVELCLGAYPGQYPRALVVESSADGIGWSPVSDGGTALETYDAAVRSPREVPITLPVGRGGIRFLRLRQTGTDTRGWTIVELHVIG